MADRKRPVKGPTAKGVKKKTAAGGRSAKAGAADRGKAVNERQESAEKYKFLIDATNTGYVILDDRGRVLDANQEYVRMTGRGKLADILGRVVTDWTAPYDLERNAAEVAKCLETGSVRNLVIDYVDAKGGAIPVEINATVLPGPPARIFTVCRDIADRKRADQEIAAREELLRQIMDTASVAIFLVDKAGRITHANKRMAEMFGFAMQDLVGSEYVSLVHPSEREIGRKKMLALLASEIDSVDLERHYWRKDGTEFWGHLAGRRFHDLHGTEIGLIGVITDIDKRRQAEEQLRSTDQLFSLFMRHSPIYTYIKEITPADSRVLYASENFQEMVGIPGSNMAGKTMAELFPAEFAAKITADDWAVVSSGQVLKVDEDLNGRNYTTIKSPLVQGGKTLLVGYTIDITDRKRAEDALRESERMLQVIIDTEPDCIKMIDAEGRLIMMNRAGLEMIQADTLDELKGREVCALVAPEHQQAFKDLTRRVFQGETGSMEFRMVGLRGKQLWLETHAVPLRNQKNEIIAMLGVTRDITGRRQAEEALRESEVRTRSIIESIPVGMHRYRLEPDGRLVFTGANPAADRMLGVDNSIFVGKTIEEAFPPLAETEVPQRYRDVVTTGQSWQTESVEYKDNVIAGAFEVHAFRTGPDTMVAAFEVITERKRAEMAVRESEAKFRRLYNETPVMLHSIDRDAVVVDVNDHWLRVMGYAREEVLGRNVTDFYTPDSTKYAREVVQPAFFRDGVVKDVPYQFIRKNGEVIDVLLSASAERDAKGAVVRSQAVIQDITERKRMEDLLRQSETTYRGILDSMKEAVYIQDETGSFIDVNKGAELMYGFSRDEFVGGSPAMVSAEGRNDLGRVMDQFQRALSGIPQTFEFWGKGKDGRVFPKEVHLYPGRYFGRTVVIAIAQDITERKRTEDALKGSEARFKAITMTASDAILLMDDRGKIVHWNPAAERIFGYSEREAIGKDLHLFLGPQRLHDDFHRGFGNFTRTGQGPVINKVVELMAVKKDGVEFPIEVSTSAMNIEGHWHALGIVRDITERKRAEEALRQSEERFRDLAESLPLTVFEMDLQGRFTYVNRVAMEQFGYTPEDVAAGVMVSQMLVPEDRGRAQEAIVRRLSGGKEENPEFVALRKDGTTFPVTVASSPIVRDGRPAGLRGIAMDLTVRKMTEEEARRNEARMSSLYRISQHPIEDEHAFLDFALNEAISLTGSSIGYLYSYDEAKREFNLSSYSRDVMKECAIADRKTCYELDRTGIWGEAVRQRKPILLNNFEAEHPLKKGYPEGHARLRKFLTVPVIMGGAVVAVVGVANKPDDYTDADVLQLNFLMDSVWKMVQRARAERALQESEERFRDLAGSLPLTIFEMDLQGRFTYVNQIALQMFGYTQQEVDAGITMAQVLVPGDRDRARATIGRRLAGTETGYNEYQGLRKDGSTFPMAVESAAILRGGRPVGLRGFSLDLSERRQLEEERLKTQKLESIGTLAGGIAHDFNNLLQGIFGYISMAKLSLGDKDKTLVMLTQAERALHQSVNLSSQLLTFSKGGKPVKKVLALPTVIERACTFSLSGSRTDCRLTIDDSLWHVEADEGQIGQVVQNIVLNADQAMPAGGTVELAARNVPAGNAALPQGLEPGNYVSLSISDSGVGIPAEYQSRIFDPYFTTKEKGSGLGLATSYSIIRNHGGLITVRSEPGAGSTFTVYLPASAAKAAAAQDQVVVAPKRAGRVLVMDDDDVVRTVAGELLRSLGHDVELAVHGGEAIEKYRQAMATGRPFDVVILDLTIRGGMGGTETVKKLLELDPAVKAVVSSGYSDDAVTSNYREHGFRSYLSKPYTAAGLNDMLNTLMS